MTYRGIVKDGAIVLENDASLPDGTTVDVTAIEQKGGAFTNHPAFGIWRDRTDLPEDSVDASAQLRQHLMRHGHCHP